ncbi:MAG: two-component sensor histidine kinase, partial [Caulobacteraceae bacterium]|nr:two-component sensor histidine kinase [Caulobacter sp.]
MAVDPGMVADAGAVSLALAAGLWALASRRAAGRRVAELEGELAALRGAPGADASAEAFDSTVLAVDAAGARLASGVESLAACARALNLPERDPADAVYAALRRSDPGHARQLDDLVARGAPCDFEVAGAGESVVAVQGRASGALAWLRLSVHAGAGLPSAARFAAAADAQDQPAWLVDGEGRLVWANRAWLAGAEAASTAEALAHDLAFDRGVALVAEDAAAHGERREALRWVALSGRRRAF